MRSGPEWEQVEKPLLEHLRILGWEVLDWSNRQEVDAVERDSERQVLLEQRLAQALETINKDQDGNDWLDETRVKAAIAELRTGPSGNPLLEANQCATELLQNGVALQGVDGGREQVVNFINWEDHAVNNFLAVSQFRVAAPGNQPAIKPDVTLFVNGIPLVVIEAKPPHTESGIADAINQLSRYANQRGTASPEGAEQLFLTNQLTVATTGTRAEAGTFSAKPEHYHAWKDPFPNTREAIAFSLGRLPSEEEPPAELSQQEILTAGMLSPKHLLDIVRHFTLFKGSGSGSETKVVCRYQQYRGVQKALRRLSCGATRAEDGNVDRRGGIVWHTQGSGKSLTMVFLIKAMRSHPDLRKFKIVLVTDRIDLEQQLRNTARLAGETVQVARSVAEVRELLSQEGSGLVMAMIQKYQDAGGEVYGDRATGKRASGKQATKGAVAFGELNTSNSILVMVDEAHRSQASTLHANLMGALPNAARIGFTGTPIIMSRRKHTLEIFGDYIDRYTLAQSEADESTVPIFYEGRTTDAAVRGSSRMDELFFRWFSDLTDDQRNTLQDKYVSVTRILESPELIAAKAKDILRHYISTVMPDGFKGIVVATSRKACLRYYDALNNARDELLADIEKQGSGHDQQQAANPVLGKFDPRADFWHNAAQQIDLIRALEFAPVFSSDHNDPPRYAKWTDKAQQHSRIDRFKLPLGSEGDGKSPLGILIVNSMLLTGFDAPWAQALYLDRMIQEAELLQAVARVNRTAEKKSYGLVVDYYGVSTQLTEALAAYAGEDGVLDPEAETALRPLTEEIAKLGAQCERVRQIFVQQGIEPAVDAKTIEDCVLLLEDEELRAKFDVAMRKFFNTFDIVLPRPEALEFLEDLKLFGVIQIQTRRRYRDTPGGDFDPYKYQEKVRRLIDQHIMVLDISKKIPAVRITDPEFRASLEGYNSERAVASEMEHALRYYIREHISEDPSYFRKLSEKVDEILERLEGLWAQVVFNFEEMIGELKSGRKDDKNTGLDPKIELPFHGIMADKLASSDSNAETKLIELTKEVVLGARKESAMVGFWDNPTKQDELRKLLKRLLDGSNLFEFASLDELAVELLELAKVNHRWLA